MKLQLEHIQGYLAHGLKCHVMGEYDYLDNGETNPVIFDIEGANKFEVETSDVPYSYEDVFPILRKLDLTKSITINGVEIIPLLELAKMQDPGLTWKLNDMYPFVYSMSYEFQFIEGNFYMNDNSDESRGINNQLQLFKWLYANKFDVDGLIDLGVAVDADTLEINPYNS